jgi:hypothetical protein
MITTVAAEAVDGASRLPASNAHFQAMSVSPAPSRERLPH